MHSTSRLGINVPDATDLESAFPLVSAQQMGILDNSVRYFSGTISNRATVVPSPLAGDLYYATDTGQLFFYNSAAAWVSLTDGIARSQLAGGFGNLIWNAPAGDVSAADGNLYLMVGAHTLTLPAPTVNRTVGIVPNSGVTGANQVTVAGTNIWGLGLSAVASFKLGTPIAPVVLVADGANWFIVSGQQDTGWVAISLAANKQADPVAGDHAWAPAARAIGDRAYLRGGIQTTATANSVIWGTVPVGTRPTNSSGVSAGVATNGATNTDAIWLQINGTASASPGQLGLIGNVASFGVLFLDGISYSLV